MAMTKCRHGRRQNTSNAQVRQEIAKFCSKEGHDNDSGMRSNEALATITLAEAQVKDLSSKIEL